MADITFVEIDFYKAMDTDAGVIVEGYASTNRKDRQGEVVDVSTLRLEDFMHNPVVLYQHNQDKPVGRVLSHKFKEEDGKQVWWIRAFIDGSTMLGREVVRLVRNGVLRAFSVAGKPKRVADNTLYDFDVFEVSIVSVPANPDALFTMAKAHGWDDDIKMWVDLGIAATTQEAMVYKAMELHHAPKKEVKPMENNKEALDGQEKQEAPITPEAVLARIEAVEAKVAVLEEQVASMQAPAEPADAEGEPQEATAPKRAKPDAKKSVVADNTSKPGAEPADRYKAAEDAWRARKKAMGWL